MREATCNSISPESRNEQSRLKQRFRMKRTGVGKLTEVYEREKVEKTNARRENVSTRLRPAKEAGKLVRDAWPDGWPGLPHHADDSALSAPARLAPRHSAGGRETCPSSTPKE